MSEAALQQASDPAVGRYLVALYSDAPPGALVELRYRAGLGMRRSFHSVADLASLRTEILARARETDVYVGVLPRVRHSGGRDDVVSEASILWVDCDQPSSVEALRRFAPDPSIVLRSGSGDNRHAYWLLSGRHPLDVIETANRQLAIALGADIGCVDAARILRPPSWNHKHHPPTPVELEQCDEKRRYDLADVVGHLPIPRDRRRGSTAPRVSDDPLLCVAPRVYIQVLSGEIVSREGKARCPLHGDRAASLQAYREPSRGWYCYGCRRGGSIYDFAAHLWGLSTRGPEFAELADALCHTFGPDDLA